MRQFRIALLGAFLLSAVAGVCGTMSGCDSGTDVSQTTASPEAKKADAKIQDGMKEFMQGKPKTKPQR